jgi:hypothetical protein
MKAFMLLILIFSVAGCATLAPAPATEGSAAADTANSAPAMTPSPDIGPRLVIPATGGAPVIGIPLGGDIFLPVTGGTPVVGIPIGP